MRNMILLVLVTTLTGCVAPVRVGMPHPVPILNSMDLMPYTVTAEKWSKWATASTPDEMRKTTITAQTLESENSVRLRFPYGPSAKVSIIVTNPASGYANVGLIASDGQIMCKRCDITVSFDGKQPQKFAADEIGHSSKMIKFTSRSFLRQIIESTNLIIELDFYPDGLKQFKFDTKGLVAGQK